MGWLLLLPWPDWGKIQKKWKFVYVYICVYNIYVHYILYMCKICIYHACTVDIYNVECIVQYTYIRYSMCICIQMFVCIYVCVHIACMYVLYSFNTYRVCAI